MASLKVIIGVFTYVAITSTNSIKISPFGSPPINAHRPLIPYPIQAPGLYPPLHPRHRINPHPVQSPGVVNNSPNHKLPSPRRGIPPP